MRVLGIDPGLTGGACVYAPQFSIKSGMRWHVIDLPTIGEGSQRRIDAAALRDFVVRLTPDRAFLEDARTMPQNGVVQSFRFGRTVGAIDATIACCGIPITYVVPQRWKKFHGLKGSDKDQSRARAIALAPELSALLERKKDHGRAEAVLLALFGADCLAPIRAE